MINISSSTSGSFNPYGGLNLQKEQKKQYIKEQYNEIYAHEMAHKQAAGKFGGSIVIENNADGIPVQGHVDVQMPVLNKKNPEETIEHADIVIKSAMAPDDPSGQDYKVADEAKSIKAQAESEKSKHPLGDYEQVGRNLNLFA